MKYIIKESQYKNLFQHLIDEKLNYIRETCTNYPSEYIQDIGWDTCRQVYDLEEIEVIDVQTIIRRYDNNDENYTIKVDLICKTYTLNANFDEVVYDLKSMIKKITGFENLFFNYEIKLLSNPNW